MSDETPKPSSRRRGLAGRVVDAVVSPIVSPIVTAVDVDQVIEKIDVDHLVDRIDVDRLIGKIDVNALLDRIDANALLDRIDANALLDRVDPDRLLDRVDLDRLVARLDLDAVMSRVDVNALVQRTELGAVIARSTTGVFGELLDTGRAVTLSIDQVVQGTAGRLVRHRGESRPGRPGDLDDVVDIRPMTLRDRGVAVQGRLAGSLSRFLAFLLDQLVLGTLFVWGQTLLSLAVSVVLDRSYQPSDHRWFVAVAYVVWAFIYLAVPLAATGRTIGMAVLGLRVVRADGTHLDGRRAVVRTIAFPLSFLVFGIGLLLGLIRRDRRELHDLIAGTSVIYAWDAELARLRGTDAES